MEPPLEGDNAIVSFDTFTGVATQTAVEAEAVQNEVSPVSEKISIMQDGGAIAKANEAENENDEQLVVGGIGTSIKFDFTTGGPEEDEEDGDAMSSLHESIEGEQEEAKFQESDLVFEQGI